MIAIRYPRTMREAFQSRGNPPLTARVSTHYGRLEPIRRWRAPWWEIAAAPVWLPAMFVVAVMAFVIGWLRHRR